MTKTPLENPEEAEKQSVPVQPPKVAERRVIFQTKLRRFLPVGMDEREFDKPNYKQTPVWDSKDMF
jgi:hypothetical protein